MKPYFEKMTEFGHTLKKGRIKSTEENLNSIKKIEEDVADEVNQVKLAREYHEKSRPLFCAKNGLVDEIVPLCDLRKYLVAFTGAAYQNPKSICPQHHMILPRIIKG